MLLAVVRCGETLGASHAVGALHEDRLVTFAIRLEHDVLAVWRPHRKLVSTAKGEPPQGIRPAQCVDPDHRLVPVIAVESQVGAFRRRPDVDERSGWHVDPGHGSGSIGQRQRDGCEAEPLVRPGKKHQVSGRGDVELGHPSSLSDALDGRHRTARDLQPIHAAAMP